MVEIEDMEKRLLLCLFGFLMKENTVLMKWNHYLEIQFEKIFLKGKNEFTYWTDNDARKIGPL